MRRSARRYYRTLLLGLGALALMLWVAVDQFGIPRRDMSELVLGSVLAAALVILGAAVVLTLCLLLRWLWRRRDAGGR